MHAKPGLSFHVKVRVISQDPRKREIDGLLGYVAGITETPDDDGTFGYGIFIYNLGIVWYCLEHECEPTGDIGLEAVRSSEEHRKRLALRDRLE